MSIKTPSGDKHTVVVRGIYDPPEAEPAARPTSAMTQKAFDSAFAQPEEQLHVPRRGRRLRPRRSRRRRRASATPSSTPAPPTPKDATKDMATVLAHALRAARLLGHREPVRHGQHDGALGVRAHPRDRDAAHDRHDAPPGAPHDPPREHHHRADRRRARPRARRCSSPRSSRRRCRWTGCRSRCPSRRWRRSRWSPSLAGIGAAILPARRASRLNVLEALHYE